MNYYQFKKWCSLREPEFNKYETDRNLSIIALFTILILLFIWSLNYKYIIAVLFKHPLSEAYFNFGIVVLFIAMFSITYFLSPKMNWVEYISCLLVKISKEIELCQTEKDKKELIKKLKILKRISRFEFRTTKEDLFKKESDIKNFFFTSLSSIPERIYYAISSNTLNKINSDDIQKLAFSIYTDNDDKVPILNKIIKDNPDIEEKKSFIESLKLTKLYQNNWIKLALVTLILILFFYFFIYNWLGIDKNNTFTGFIALIGVVIYVIFKK